MISKQFRLKEKEVKKVLQRGKPFFSYGIVLNLSPSLLHHHRFSIVVGSKSTGGSVERNFFRRFFYTLVIPYMELSKNKYFDYVFVVKKQKRLDKNDQNSIKDFETDIRFVLKKSSETLSGNR